MITRKEQRKRRLKRVGFLGFEAEALSVLPLKLVPYMKSMIRERRDLFRDALRHKATTAQYEAVVREIYIKNGFQRRNKVGKLISDPWAMVKDYEGRYKARYPAYESPWEKNRRTFPDFMAKIERTIATQRGLRVRPA